VGLVFVYFIYGYFYSPVCCLFCFHFGGAMVEVCGSLVWYVGVWGVRACCHLVCLVV